MQFKGKTITGASFLDGGGMCLQSAVCQHYIELTFEGDEPALTVLANAHYIYALFHALGRCDALTGTGYGKNHFKCPPENSTWTMVDPIA